MENDHSQPGSGPGTPPSGGSSLNPIAKDNAQPKSGGGLRPKLICLFALLAVALILDVWTRVSPAQETPTEDLVLLRSYFRSGEQTLRAFAPVSKATRNSIVKLNVDGETVALGTVVSAGGLVLTKASEIKPGSLTCWLASDKEVKAQLLGVDEEEDVALVRVQAPGLKPITWAAGDVAEGQWAVTPGIADTPNAVGIISALPRRIRPQRAFIGVQFDFDTSLPRIGTLIPGMSAQKAGLKPGDLIAAVNGSPVTNREQVVEILRDFREGQNVTVRVRRAAEQFDTALKMTVPHAGEAGAEFYPQRSGDLGAEVSRRSLGFERAIEHDTVLQPWLCGGPLVNLDGQAIGLNIARASRVTTYALPAALVQRIFASLNSSPAHPAKTPAR
ncbi:MAG: trypsin-like peptidase domain-containing protein [Limisphaerales bacterium]